MIRNLVALRCDFCNETRGAIFDAKDEQQMLDIATQSGWKVRPAGPGVTYAICVRCVEKGRGFPTPASASYVAPESDLLQAEVERLNAERDTALGAVERTVQMMHDYNASARGRGEVFAHVKCRQVISLLSLTWPDGNNAGAPDAH